MAGQKVLEQHIAVFGESGSGKTVMVSSLYDSEQEPENFRKGTFTSWPRTPAKARSCTRTTWA